MARYIYELAHQPIRILQVTAGLNCGGVETWLLHVLRHTDRSRLAMDFLVHGPGPYYYQTEALRLGARLHRCDSPRNPWAYAANLTRILRTHGPYDIIHSHLHQFSGQVMRIAVRAGIPARIVHSHNDTRPIDRTAHPARRAYIRLMEHWIGRYATLALAVSEPAGECLFRHTNLPVRRLDYSVDFTPFTQPPAPATLRAQLGIPPDALVIGHAGRFEHQKNHDFVAGIAAALAQRAPNSWFLLLGDGPLRPAIEARFTALGLRHRATFTGVRRDIARLMSAAMDVFVFPSHYEGIGLVVVEAQAAGLPTLISDRIPREAIVLPELIDTLPLQAPAAEWAERALHLANRPRPSIAERLRRMNDSRFGVQSLTELLSVYEQLVSAPAPESLMFV